MFSIGEKVMYGGTGVCVVEEITSVKFSASQPGKPYYLLRPMYQTGTIQTPADSGKVPIRPVMNRSEAEAVIDAMPTVPAEICTEKNLSALRNYYQKQITSFDSMDLIRLAKSIRAKKIEAEKRQKRIGSTDEKYLRRAEELLFGELAVAREKAERKNACLFNEFASVIIFAVDDLVPLRSCPQGASGCLASWKALFRR